MKPRREAPAGAHRRRRNGGEGEGGGGERWPAAAEMAGEPSPGREHPRPEHPGPEHSGPAQPEWGRSRQARTGPAAREPEHPGRPEPGRGHRGPDAHGLPGNDDGQPAPVAVRTPTGWRVGHEEVPDLTSAMVLADLLAADLPTETMPAVAQAPASAGRERSRSPQQARHTDPPDPRRLQQTVAQLEHALTARVRVEQAIGVLAERHRLRPRQAFELLRSVARARGRRVLEIAAEVVESASNPLLRIPEELAKPPSPRRRGRITGPTLGNGLQLHQSAANSR